MGGCLSDDLHEMMGEEDIQTLARGRKEIKRLGKNHTGLPNAVVISARCPYPIFGW